MTHPVSRHLMKYLNGRCFDFSLALSERTERPIFVAIGSGQYPEHVALVIGGLYADVRGLLPENEFLAHHAGKPIVEISRQDIEFHCGASGMEPPYRGHREISQARKAVKEVFPKKFNA